MRAGAGTLTVLVLLFLARMVIPLPWRGIFEITLLLAPAISFAIAAFAYDRAAQTLRLDTREGALTLISTNGLSTSTQVVARTTPATGRLVVSNNGSDHYDVRLESTVVLQFRRSRTSGKAWLQALHRLAEVLDVPLELPDEEWIRADYQRLDLHREEDRRQLPPKS